ncbi:hypothetical protein [Providencia burhodogranariea]|uniref:Fimbrial protein n=1 Tax=Providencia burhodogranariea DSM 19968 TaxID=1141662 RepID=K8WIN7_9GAMM|nr:hypothetical protein [Providencia burhodogranariea]EKT56100.1 fimbrial protein [Providencia burhodogranariea DSM 19968]
MKVIFGLKALLLVALLACYGNAYALYLDSDISSIESAQQFFSKSYINDTKRTNLYNFSVYKIDKPGSNEQAKVIEDGEVIFTPLKKILLPGEHEFFKIFYRGKEDDTERYYKIIISETPFEMKKDGQKNKQPLFYPTLSLETYFVVRPVSPKFKYELNQDKGILENAGNTYFRVLLHDNCEEDTDSIPYMLYLLPNQVFQDARLKKKSRKYIIIFDKYHSIGNCE